MALTKTQETMFFPLLGRAEAAHKWPELFEDPWAEQAQQIVSQEGTTATGLSTFPQAVYGLRHRACITDIKTYLVDHPQAAVVNIGCGLDRLEEDLADTPHGTIYNLDFPETIQMRQRWLPQSNSVDLPYSATDHMWMEQVDAAGGMIAVAAGVMYYLENDDAAALIDAMAQRFPGGRFVYDAESPFITAQSEKQISGAGVSAKMPFRVKDPYSVKQWSRTIESVEVVFNFSHYLPAEQRKKLPLRVRSIFKALEVVRGMYVVTVNFTDSI